MMTERCDKKKCKKQSIYKTDVIAAKQGKVNGDAILHLTLKRLVIMDTQNNTFVTHKLKAGTHIKIAGLPFITASETEIKGISGNFSMIWDETKNEESPAEDQGNRQAIV